MVVFVLDSFLYRQVNFASCTESDVIQTCAKRLFSTCLRAWHRIFRRRRSTRADDQSKTRDFLMTTEAPPAGHEAAARLQCATSFSVRQRRDYGATGLRGFLHFSLPLASLDFAFIFVQPIITCFVGCLNIYLHIHTMHLCLALPTSHFQFTVRRCQMELQNTALVPEMRDGACVWDRADRAVHWQCRVVSFELKGNRYVIFAYTYMLALLLLVLICLRFIRLWILCVQFSPRDLLALHIRCAERGNIFPASFTFILMKLPRTSSDVSHHAHPFPPNPNHFPWSVACEPVKVTLNYLYTEIAPFYKSASK